MNNALGMIETKGLVASIEASDQMVKGRQAPLAQPVSPRRVGNHALQPGT